MSKNNFQLNQFHRKYSVKITDGLDEDRLYDETDEDAYGDAFEGNDFDEVFDNILVKNFSIAA
jgi:hypothetical protein